MSQQRLRDSHIQTQVTGERLNHLLCAQRPSKYSTEIEAHNHSAPVASPRGRANELLLRMSHIQERCKVFLDERFLLRFAKERITREQNHRRLQSSAVSNSDNRFVVKLPIGSGTNAFSAATACSAVSIPSSNSVILLSTGAMPAVSS